MNLQLIDRTCLVTGASSGIGVAIARLMAREGAKMAITARRGERLKEVADSIATDGLPRPAIIAADITAPDGPQAIAHHAGNSSVTSTS